MDNLDPVVARTLVQKIRTEILPFQNIESSKDDYLATHLRLAQFYYYLDEFNKAFYHLTECHGSLIRRLGLMEDLLRKGWLKPSSINWEHLSSTTAEAKEEDIGLYKRLSVMPSEWTIVQLTRIPESSESSTSADSSPRLKDMFMSRMQCGPHPDNLLVTYTDSSLIKLDVLVDINNAVKNLSRKGYSAYSVKLRKKASLALQAIASTLDDNLFMDWKCLLLGKLENVQLQSKIRRGIDAIFKEHGVSLSCKLMGLYYLMAEGVEFYVTDLIRGSIEKNLPDNKNLKKDLMNIFTSLLELYPELRGAKRHPVILILEDHLDIIPWECIPILSNQAVTRVPSVHLLYALFKAHELNIHNGLREIKEDKVNYYVINPDGNLPQTEAKLKPFFSVRLQNWSGYIGEKPTPLEMMKALSNCNNYIYCGHGSGSHLISPMDIQKLDLKNSVQIIFGCNSAALKYIGGSVPLMGDMLHYCIAGSACSMGMLYVVTSETIDEMTMELANLWLPGTPIDPKNLKPVVAFVKEPELLRAVTKLRKSLGQNELFTNRGGFISRGLPVVLVHESSVD